jgi:hypothetical protein
MRRASAASACAGCCDSPAAGSATRSIDGRTPLCARRPAGSRRCAMPRLCSRLDERFAHEIDRRRIVPVRRALAARHAELGGEDLAAPVAAFCADLGAVRDRVPSWPPVDDFAILARGLKCTYERARRAMRAAYRAVRATVRLKRARFGLRVRCLWALSSAGEHYVDIVGVGGSIPPAPTTLLGTDRTALVFIDVLVLTPPLS